MYTYSSILVLCVCVCLLHVTKITISKHFEGNTFTLFVKFVYGHILSFTFFTSQRREYGRRTDFEKSKKPFRVVDSAPTKNNTWKKKKLRATSVSIMCPRGRFEHRNVRVLAPYRSLRANNNIIIHYTYTQLYTYYHTHSHNNNNNNNMMYCVRRRKQSCVCVGSCARRPAV